MKIINLRYNANLNQANKKSFPFQKMEDRYSNELMNLGKQIRRFRKMRRLTQIDLELKSGIGNGDISRIENGKKNLEFYTIVKLAEALEVELKDLFSSCLE